MVPKTGMNVEMSNKVRAVAHRGYPAKYPENTMTSYRAAYELGFMILELDVHLSEDGVPVLMHDPTVDRTTNGKGWVKDYTLAKLKQLKVGGYESIPTLEEALTFAKDKMIVAIELKQMGNLYPGLEEAVLKVVRRTGMLDQVYVNSFDHYAIVKMRELSDEVKVGLILGGPTPAAFPLAEEIRARSLAIGIYYLTDEYVRQCEKRGIQLIVWPADTKQQMDLLFRYPSVLGTTNALERFKSYYEKHCRG